MRPFRRASAKRLRIAKDRRRSYRGAFLWAARALARTLLQCRRMAPIPKSDPLTIPLLVVIWTTLLCAFIMTLVVLLMR